MKWAKFCTTICTIIIKKKKYIYIYINKQKTKKKTHYTLYNNDLFPVCNNIIHTPEYVVTYKLHNTSYQGIKYLFSLSLFLCVCVCVCVCVCPVIAVNFRVLLLVSVPAIKQFSSKW